LSLWAKQSRFFDITSLYETASGYFNQDPIKVDISTGMGSEPARAGYRKVNHKVSNVGNIDLFVDIAIDVGFMIAGGPCRDLMGLVQNKTCYNSLKWLLYYYKNCLRFLSPGFHHKN